MASYCIESAEPINKCHERDGSRFHKLSQSRGQQGMGIAAAGMYAQLTTEMFISIDTAKNRPELHKKAHLQWDRTHGTRVEADLEGHYL